jgi:hypothetical protein
METMMVRLASERVLRDPDLATLGRFRQGFQSLRETIREQKELGWSSSEHKKYRGFKELAISVSRLVSTVDVSPIPTADHAQESLRIITSNLWEGYWEVHREGRHPPVFISLDIRKQVPEAKPARATFPRRATPRFTYDKCFSRRRGLNSF